LLRKSAADTAASLRALSGTTLPVSCDAMLRFAGAIAD
jgi:hypothetical protein